MRQGDVADRLFMIERGEVEVLVELLSLLKEDFRILYRAQPRIARDVSCLARAPLDQSRQAAGTGRVTMSEGALIMQSSG